MDQVWLRFAVDLESSGNEVILTLNRTNKDCWWGAGSVDGLYGEIDRVAQALRRRDESNDVFSALNWWCLRLERSGIAVGLRHDVRDLARRAASGAGESYDPNEETIKHWLPLVVWLDALISDDHRGGGRFLEAVERLVEVWRDNESEGVSYIKSARCATAAETFARHQRRLCETWYREMRETRETTQTGGHFTDGAMWRRLAEADVIPNLRMSGPESFVVANTHVSGLMSAWADSRVNPAGQTREDERWQGAFALLQTIRNDDAHGRQQDWRMEGWDPLRCCVEVVATCCRTTVRWRLKTRDDDDGNRLLLQSRQFLIRHTEIRHSATATPKYLKRSHVSEPSSWHDSDFVKIVWARARHLNWSFVKGSPAKRIETWSVYISALTMMKNDRDHWVGASCENAAGFSPPTERTSEMPLFCLLHNLHRLMKRRGEGWTAEAKSLWLVELVDALLLVAPEELSEPSSRPPPTVPIQLLARAAANAAWAVEQRYSAADPDFAEHMPKEATQAVPPYQWVQNNWRRLCADVLDAEGVELKSVLRSSTAVVSMLLACVRAGVLTEGGPYLQQTRTYAQTKVAELALEHACDIAMKYSSFRSKKDGNLMPDIPSPDAMWDGLNAPPHWWDDLERERDTLLAQKQELAKLRGRVPELEDDLGKTKEDLESKNERIGELTKDRHLFKGTAIGLGLGLGLILVIGAIYIISKWS